MPNSKNSETLPYAASVSQLRIDFFESGVGETILITFPDGGLGIVDAHPSAKSSTNFRPGIRELVKGRNLHFVCLSHPHADHGIDLIPILEQHPAIGAFWHTLSDVGVFIFSEGQTKNYRSPFRDVVKLFHQGYGEFLTNIYGNVALRDLPVHKLRDDIEPTEIAGVKIHVLSPAESEQNRFTTAYQQIARDQRKKTPDSNALSAVLALEYGGKVVILGSDALKGNWTPAVKKFRKLRLGNASILKVPHHGAKNALETRKGKASYLDVCSHETISVLFAGDSNHPHPHVEEKLQAKTRLACVANGRKCLSSMETRNPLQIAIPGAVAVNQRIKPCQPVISFEIHSDGSLLQTAGHLCDACSICVN